MLRVGRLVTTIALVLSVGCGGSVAPPIGDGTDPNGGSEPAPGTEAVRGAPRAAAPEDRGEAAWSPRELRGLAVWLDDAGGIETDPERPDRVARWRDRSGGGNDARPAGGREKMPALASAAVGPARDAVACDGDAYLTIPTSSSLAFEGDWAIVMVAKVSAAVDGRSGAAAGATLVDKGDAVSLSVSPEPVLRLSVSGPVPGSAAIVVPPSVYRVFSARGKKLDVRAGAAQASGPSTIMRASAAPLTLCRGAASVAEVIVVRGSLSDVDLARTYAYLHAKFGLDD